MGATKIPWCDRTWSPITGCTRVSAGCAHCYAHAIHKRFGKGRPFTPTFHADRLDEPLHWRKPSRVFCVSMGDLFHEQVTDGQIAAVFMVMSALSPAAELRQMKRLPVQTFIVLTKRPERMRQFITTYRFRSGDTLAEKPLCNVWLGVSVENQATADERIPILLQTPAAVRFVSCEPLLGPINIPRYFLGRNAMCNCPRSLLVLAGLPSIEPDYLTHQGCPQCGRAWSKFTGINWIIGGSESGPGARPCDPSWVRSIIGQCKDASVPLFVKQWRENGKLVKMPRIDGKVYDQLPDAGGNE